MVARRARIIGHAGEFVIYLPDRSHLVAIHSPDRSVTGDRRRTRGHCVSYVLCIGFWFMPLRVCGSRERKKCAKRCSHEVQRICHSFPLLIVALQASLEEKTTTSDMAA